MGTTPTPEADWKSCAAEDRLRLVIDTIPVLVVRALADGSVDFVNQRWLEYTGVGLENARGDGWLAAIHPEDLATFDKGWRARLESGNPFEAETRIRRTDGENRWFQVCSAPLRDESGRIINWYTTCNYIEERGDQRTCIEDFKAAEAFLRLVVDTTPALIHTGRPDGYLDYFNKQWLDYLGLSLEDISGWRWTNSIHPEDVESIVDKWRASLTTGELFEAEARVRRADGEYRTLLHRKVPLRDSHGKILKWYGSSLDIEDRKRAEDELGQMTQELRRRAMYLAEAQKLSHTGSFGWSVPTGEIFWSEESFRIFQYDPTTKPTVDLALQRVHPEDAVVVKQTIERASRDQEDFDLEHRLLMPDSSVKYVHVVAHALTNASGSTELVGAVMDITAAKCAEEELQKAIDEIRNLRDQLYRENLALRQEIDQSSMFEEIIGSSEALRRVLVHVAKVSPTDSTVLITGETGTGKELVARAIHKRSQRSTRAFAHLNCAAIPPSLVASELFGHEKGAFTGAAQRRLGRFELADGGTLFLDEIGELPAETQIALLRVLQEREFERVGGSQPIPVDVRVLAATNRDLQAAVDAGTFRQDLFYRLNVFPIRVPALRERLEDIPLLVEYLTERFASKPGRKSGASKSERWSCSRPTIGQATFANCRMWSSGR